MGVVSEHQKESHSRKIAIGGIVTALNVVLLWLTSVLVFNKLLILVICTLLIAVVVIQINRRIAWIVYVASSVVGVLLVPNKLIMMYYIALFGNYAIIKQMIESLNKNKWVYCLKTLYFNGVLIIILSGIQWLIGVSFENIIDFNGMLAKVSDIQLSMSVNMGIIIVVYQVAWTVGDRLLSMIITMYYQRFYK